MKSRRRTLLRKFRLYAVTDLKKADAAFFRKAEQSLQAGVDVLQLRSKNLSDRELIQAGKRLRELTRKHGCLFFINDRPDLTLVCGADGVHLGQEDMPIAAARKILRDSRILIGKSTHSLKQALAAVEEGADYIGVGPVFTTPTKPDYRPVGLRLLTQVSRRVKIPFVAIGGINGVNLPLLVKAGAARAAVVRGIWGQENPFQAVLEMKRILNRIPLK